MVAVATAVLAVVSLPQVAHAANRDMCCNQTLWFGQELNTGTGDILRVQSSDGNVVLYSGGVARWHTNTVGQVNDFLRAQSDGNVVVYTSGGQWLWQTKTSIYPGAFLRLQDDGNLVVYGGGAAVWAASWTQEATGSKTYAQKQFPHYGWSVSTQFPCLDNLWTRESGWRWNASNPSSGAYGIPQALPGSKMGSAGTNWPNDGLTQIQWGHQYIRDRYGAPCGAWNHFQQYGWY